MDKRIRELILAILFTNLIYLIGVQFLRLIQEPNAQISAFVILYLFLPVLNILLSFAILTKGRSSLPLKEKELPAPTVITSEEILDSIRSIIFQFGERLPKKHGSWICLRIKNGFFSADSWNGAIHYFDGEPEYDYWTGFGGSPGISTYLGLSDRGWRGSDALPLDVENYKKYYDMLSGYVERHIKKESP